jgi:hypothetical protein
MHTPAPGSNLGSGVSRRIVVKGAPGAGKSTLADELACRLGLAHVELDALHHGPDWAAPPVEEFRARVQAALAAAPAGWVTDGNYDSKLGDAVVGAADTIVWLDLPIGVKLWRLWRRTARRVVVGVELWNGNRETWRGGFGGPDALFPWAVRVHFRHRREWPARFGDDPRLVRLRSDAEVRRWLGEQVER